MKELENKLQYLKNLIACNYGNRSNFDLNKIIVISDEATLLRQKINRLKVRKSKLKNLISSHD